MKIKNRRRCFVWAFGGLQTGVCAWSGRTRQKRPSTSLPDDHFVYRLDYFIALLP
jgi:hypothetical protein